jgi:signal transduction histidine kinase
MDEGNTADDGRVLIVAPTRRDGEVTCALLRTADVPCDVYFDLKALTQDLDDRVGALVLTDVSLTDRGVTALLDRLDRQPAWSDVPAVVMVRDREHSPAAARALSRLTNVTILDRPTSTRSMVSAVKAALRARKRQYQLRDQMAAQLRAENALREADHRKDEFLAILAHELRNPLAPLRNGLHLLARAPDQTSHSATVLAMMERQFALLVKLIDELLDIARISTGRVVLHRERVDMRTVIQSALEMSQPAVAAARHRLRLEMPSDSVLVMGDFARLAQVVSNLVNNAAKYTPNEGLIIVSLAQEGAEAVVRVADTGVGIPPDVLEDVFGMFTQVNSTLDRAQGGLGIGLALARRLMHLHDGTVTAESAGLNKGSTFKLRLPIAGSGAHTGEHPSMAAPEHRSVRGR